MNARKNIRVSMVGSLPPHKGVSAYTRELCLAISRLGDVDLDVVSFSSLYPRWLYPGGDPDHSTSAVQLPGVAVRRTLRWWNPLGWLISGLQLRGDVVHAQWWSYPLAPVYAVVLGLARLRSKRVLLTVHNVEPHEPGTLRRLANMVILPLAQHIIVHSEQNARVLKARGISRDRITVVPHGVGEVSRKDAQRRNIARDSLAFAQDTPLALFLGNVRPYKGLDVLLDAFAIVRRQLPQAQLAIVGQQWQDSTDPRDQIARLGLEDCTRVVDEYVSDDEMERWLDACDIAVYPYTHFDAQSGAACTALRRGCAVIVTEVGGLLSLVRDDRAHVPPADSAALAQALKSVLSDNRLRGKLQADSVEIAQTFSWPTIASRTAGVYACLFEGPQHRFAGGASTTEELR